MFSNRKNYRPFLSMLRCRACDKLLDPGEIDYYDIFDCLCMDCFEEVQKAISELEDLDVKYKLFINVRSNRVH